MQLWRDPEKAAENRERLREAVADLKAETQKAKTQTATNQDIGSRISRLGWKLTVLFTVPLVLTALFGVVGVAVSVLFIFLYFASRKA
jgi:hypothetical protein